MPLDPLPVGTVIARKDALGWTEWRVSEHMGTVASCGSRVRYEFVENTEPEHRAGTLVRTHGAIAADVRDGVTRVVERPDEGEAVEGAV